MDGCMVWIHSENKKHLNSRSKNTLLSHNMDVFFPPLLCWAFHQNGDIIRAHWTLVRHSLFHFYPFAILRQNYNMSYLINETHSFHLPSFHLSLLAPTQLLISSACSLLWQKLYRVIYAHRKLESTRHTNKRARVTHTRKVKNFKYTRRAVF